MNSPSGYAAAHEGAAWFDLSDRPRLSLSGKDAASFLHGQCSNDIKALAPWSGCRAFILDPQAHPFAQVWIMRRDEDFLVAGPAVRRDTLFARLDRYLYADKVEMKDLTAQTGFLTLAGPRAAEILASVSLALISGRSALNGIPIERWPRKRTAVFGMDLLCDRGALPGVTAAITRAGAVAGSPEAMEILRIESGIPACDIDYTEQNILPELNQRASVSYAKGCYIGQEIVERVRSRGHANRRLCAVDIAGEEAPMPGPLLYDGKEAGALTSAVFSPQQNKVIGLAMVRSEFADGAQLQNNEGRAVIVMPLPDATLSA